MQKRKEDVAKPVVPGAERFDSNEARGALTDGSGHTSYDDNWERGRKMTERSMRCGW